MRAGIGAALFAAGLVPTNAVPAGPPCAPPGEGICRVMETPEFVSAYRAAYDHAPEPADMVYEVRFSLRQAVVGTGQAGPAAIGKQMDIALDASLQRVQHRICSAAQVPGSAPAAVAEALAGAARTLGAQLTGEMLGALTGSVVGAVQPQGVKCLCKAANFDGVASACSGGGSR